MLVPSARRNGSSHATSSILARVLRVGREEGTSRWLVPLSDVAVDEELVAAAGEAVASGWWSMGPRVAEFERAFADFVGVAHALAVGSGTAAIHLALDACGCGPGDEVIVPSLTFVAAANSVVATGARPVFCDATGLTDLNLDVADVEAALTPRTRAIVVLHYGGFPCAVDEVARIASDRGIAVIEDAAHAPGARVGGRSCGALARVGCFSFFANKNLPVGEGGMVTTDDPSVAERVRLLRSHGMTTLTWDRHRGHASGYDVLDAGFNYRLDEVRAAIGLVQLRRLEAGNVARAHLWGRYRDALSDLDGLIVPFALPTDGVVPAFHLAVVVLPEGVSRDAVREAMATAGVQTSVHYPPIHRFSAYAGATGRELPHTEAVADRLLTLPLYPHMGERAVDVVVAALRAALEAAG
jgi:dTDP-4-amino-4,6-dideoxygalactose transaminase